MNLSVVNKNLLISPFFFPSVCGQLQLPSEDLQMATDTVLQPTTCFGIQLLCPVDLPTPRVGNHLPGADSKGACGPLHPPAWVDSLGFECCCFCPSSQGSHRDGGGMQWGWSGGRLLCRGTVSASRSWNPSKVANTMTLWIVPREHEAAQGSRLSVTSMANFCARITHWKAVCQALEEVNDWYKTLFLRDAGSLFEI